MSTSAPPPPAGPSKLPNAPEAASGSLKALEYVLPKFLLKRPKLPSKKMMVFLGTVSGLASLYIYDRRESKRIKESYIAKVQHLAEVPMKTWEMPRKLTVYACKWPGDDEYDRSLRYFKKYVKPVLAAAAIDYELHNGNQHGALSRMIAEKIKERRRQDLGIDPPPAEFVPPGPPVLERETPKQREMRGGTVIIGRHTLKEYMAGLKRGWTQTLEKVDDDDILARELGKDGRFDEPDVDPSSNPGEMEEASPKPAQIIFSPLQQLTAQHVSAAAASSTSQPAEPTIPPHLNIPPSQIPLQPPLLLVSYTSILGFTKIPLMIVKFFNERKHVQNGCEAAYRIIQNQTRAFDAPQGSAFTEETETLASPESTQDADTTSDLAFDLSAEQFFRKSFEDTPKDIEKARAKYYEELPTKLETARALARREREPTKDELATPPPTEVEIRAERFKKEKKWKEELEGFELAKAGSPVAWDEGFRSGLRVFMDASPEEQGEMQTPVQQA